MKRAVGLLVVLSGLLFGGGIQQYLKKAEGKTDLSKMRNIDFIYMLNLDKRPEKFQACLDQLAPYEIVPYRFSAINGWEDLTLEMVNDVGVIFQAGMNQGNWGSRYISKKWPKPRHEVIGREGRTYFGHCPSLGMIAIVLSHLSILQDAYDSGYKTIWVMEDDIEVIRNPHELSDLIDKLDDEVGYGNWDVLFTDRDTKSWHQTISCTSYAWRPNFIPDHPERFAVREPVGQDFEKIGARYGAYSMILRRSGVKKILDFLIKYKVFLPYDMEYTLPNDIRLYSLVNEVVSTLQEALSDNGTPNYAK